MSAVDLSPFRDLVPADSGLAVVSVAADGVVHSSVANVGVLTVAPFGEVAAWVAVGGAHKVALLRRHARATATLRAGWRWASVEGPVTLIGPDDPYDGFDAEAIRVLLRDVFVAAGGTHDDWDTYDRVMLEDRRTAVLITPERLYPRG
jgi:hypothetical protein